LGDLFCALSESAQAPKKRKPDEWADEERVLPPGHAEPGPFRSLRTPYMIPFMRASTGAWKGITLICGSQMGKTDSVANIFGARLDDDPVPLIYLGPTRSFVERTWEPRFIDMIDSASRLSKQIDRGKTSSKTQKSIAGVKVNFSWAGSATAIAGDPACLVVVDERDRMGSDVEGEGDPVSLANARHSTYPDGKTIVISTPLTGTVDVYKHPETGLEHWQIADAEEVQSPTWKLWQRGTRHEWMVPCPHCGEYFAPRFRHLHWPENSEPHDLTDENVLLFCVHCGEGIEERFKGEMNAKGLAVAPGEFVVDGEIRGKAPPSDWFTLWVSGLCSPWRSWTTNSREYLTAARDGDSEALQTIINTRFGELYAVSGEAPPWEDVAALRLDYRMGQIPEGVSTIMMSVDVQQDCLYYVLRGWSRHREMESWLIEHGQIFGDTNDSAIWDELSEFRTRRFGEDLELQIARCFVDQKYRAPAVFDFCRKHKNWAYPIAGRMPKSETPEAQRPLDTSSVEVDEKGKILKPGAAGLQRWSINTDYFKRWLHDRISLGNKGGFHLSADTTEDYCKQLVAEARVVKPNGRVMWLQLSRDNHYLDCEMMQIACAYSVRLQHLAARLPAPAAEGSAQPEPSKPKPVKRRRNWSSSKW
jgi:phage terminase large subunit GpA-like protein